MNALVGFWQEYTADNAVELLKKRLTSKVPLGCEAADVNLVGCVKGNSNGNIIPKSANAEVSQTIVQQILSSKGIGPRSTPKTYVGRLPSFQESH